MGNRMNKLASDEIRAVVQQALNALDAGIKSGWKRMQEDGEDANKDEMFANATSGFAKVQEAFDANDFEPVVEFLAGVNNRLMMKHGLWCPNPNCTVRETALMAGKAAAVVEILRATLENESKEKASEN